MGAQESFQLRFVWAALRFGRRFRSLRTFIVFTSPLSSPFAVCRPSPFRRVLPNVPIACSLCLSVVSECFLLLAKFIAKFWQFYVNFFALYSHVWIVNNCCGKLHSGSVVMLCYDWCGCRYCCCCCCCLCACAAALTHFLLLAVGSASLSAWFACLAYHARQP